MYSNFLLALPKTKNLASVLVFLRTRFTHCPGNPNSYTTQASSDFSSLAGRRHSQRKPLTQKPCIWTHNPIFMNLTKPENKINSLTFHWLRQELRFSLTFCKIPWLFPYLEKFLFFPDFSLTVATLSVFSRLKPAVVPTVTWSHRTDWNEVVEFGI